MKSKLTAISLLAMGAFTLYADSITVGWMLYPLAKKLCTQYEKDTGKKAPELKLSNQAGADLRMRGPDGTPTSGFVTMDPLKKDSKLDAIPICSKGFFFYTHTANPFLDRLDQAEIPASIMKKIWFEGASWEELVGDGSGKKTKISAIAPSREFLVLIGKRNADDSKLPLMNGDSGLKAAAGNRLSLGACAMELITNHVIPKTAGFAPTIEPLRFLELPNGNYRLIRYGTSGGRSARIHNDQFGGILAEGEFLRYPVVLQQPKGTSRAFADALAKAGNKIGMEDLRPLDAFPLKIEFAQKQKNDRKFVFAHAMQCFLLGGIPEGFAHSYPSTVKSEDFKNWPPTSGPEVRTWWSERLVPYVHKQELDSSRKDLDCAEAGGLDALGLLIYPGCLSENNPWNKGLHLMMEAAQTHKVKVLFDLWGTFPANWSPEAKSLYTEEHGKKLKEWMDRYPNAFLRINGKTAICFGRDMVSFGQSASDYDAFFKALGGRNQYYLIATMMDSRSHNVFSGWEKLGDISTMWFVHCGWGDKVLNHILLPLKARGENPCWGISPGYYRANFGTNPNGGCVTEGFGACKLADDWRDAIRVGAGAAYVQSWNDMGEDHHILESNFRGDSYLRINRYFADWLRSGKKPEIKEEKILLFHRRHLIDARLDKKTGRLAENPTWTSASLTDYVHVVTMLKKPGDVSVRLGSQHYTLKNVQPGFREWLLLVPKKKDHKGNMPFWNRGSYEVTQPVDTEYRKTTKLPKLDACTPEASVSRNGKTVLNVVSKTGIADHFKFQTLSVIGTVSK